MRLNTRKTISFSLGYFKFGIIVDRTSIFHLKDAGDFLDLDLSKTIKDLISKAEKKNENSLLRYSNNCGMGSRF